MALGNVYIDRGQCNHANITTFQPQNLCHIPHLVLQFNKPPFDLKMQPMGNVNLLFIFVTLTEIHSI